MTTAQERFQRCLTEVLKHEGGYVDHPRDPGGATNMGITHRTLADWRGRPVTKDEVRNLSRAEAAAIYRARYWNAVRGDELPAGIDFVTFDPAVNSGPRRGVEWLQRALNAVRTAKVAVDGAMGRQTASAARSVAQEGLAVQVVRQACAKRMGFLRALGTFSTFGRGWTRRVAEVEAVSVRWAAEDAGASARNALVAGEQQARNDAGAARTTGQSAGVATPAAGVVADQATDMPMWGTAGLVILGLIVVVVAIGRVQQHREREAAYRRQALEAQP